MTVSRMEGRVEGVDSAKEAIRLLFDMIIHRQDTEPAGCLLVNTAVELANHDPEATTKVNDAFLNTERLLEQLITRGQASGEISEHLRAADLAVFLHNALVGLRVMVKITPEPAKLQRIADTTLAVLD
ncbi:HTH-type transcriptional repressor ComR [compost metagenome]